jgi:hypothetical protein
MFPDPNPDWWPSYLQVADATVNAANLNPLLQAFLASAAALHWSMFRTYLVVTSANDGTHAKDSKHFLNDAVDIRSRDLDMEQQNSFARAMVGMQQAAKVGIFDERFIGEPHWHVETA